MTLNFDCLLSIHINLSRMNLIFSFEKITIKIHVKIWIYELIWSKHVMSIFETLCYIVM
jgi:hypothetical protein